MSDSRDKVLKDPVHGYITVPRDLCDDFVDTEVFQRLRSIEQTSMRCLFPGGRHDRFIHSIGVYHLAKKVYEALVVNVQDQEVAGVLSDAALKDAFLVASLMHDCGHAPFSHTFEDLYNLYCDGAEHNSAYEALNGVVDDRTRAELIDHEQSEKPPAAHEAMSAYVLLKRFSKALSDRGICPSLVARMITGCQHVDDEGVRAQVENILIGLLNGYAIDVDKLDYIARDTWASGVHNFSIDLERLISGATITRLQTGNRRLVFAYLPRSLGVVQTVIDARNHLYEWIYGHHTVLYYAEVLLRSVKSMGAALSNCRDPNVEKNSPREILKRMFSPALFEEGAEGARSDGGDLVRLMNDGDLLYLVKATCPDDIWYRSYSCHQPIHFSVWKTSAEYRALVKRPYQIAMAECVRSVRKKFDLTDDECFACKDMAHKLSQLDESSVWIEMSPSSPVSLCSLANLPQYKRPVSNVKVPAFYLYVCNRMKDRRNEIIDHINKISEPGFIPEVEELAQSGQNAVS